jgi:hypothetical protein
LYQLSFQTQRSHTLLPRLEFVASGWLCLFDPSTNKKYYWDQKNNVTTYEKPTAKEPASQVGAAVMAQRGCAG